MTLGKIPVTGMVKYIFVEIVISFVPICQYLAAGVDALHSSGDASGHSASRYRNKDKIQIRNLRVNTSQCLAEA